MPLSKNVHHIFMNWDNSKCFDLMFQIKKQIKEKEGCFIPLSAHTIDKEVIAKIKDQLKESTETRIYMSDKNCIHALRISKIETKTSAKTSKEIERNNISDFESVKAREWIYVSDFYVLDVNHQDDNEFFMSKMKEYSGLDLEVDANLHLRKAASFVIENDKSIFDNLTFGKEELWVDSNRAYTYNYMVCSNKLKDIVFGEYWDKLNTRTQHILINSEIAKSNTIFFNFEKRCLELKKAFDFYKEAITVELFFRYLYPLGNLANQYEDFSLVVKEKKLSSKFILSDRKFTETVDIIDNYHSHFFMLLDAFSNNFKKKEYIFIDQVLTECFKEFEAIKKSEVMYFLNTISIFEKHLNDVIKKSNKSPNISKFKELYILFERMSGNLTNENILINIVSLQDKSKKSQKTFSELIDELEGDTYFKIKKAA
jgi:hypothetical protein